MKWATRELIHFDRVVSAWLIQRFVDREAQFVFLAAEETADDNTTAFGVSGARLGSHDGESTTFQRILDAYSISDAALDSLSTIVSHVVEHVLCDHDRVALAGRDPHVAGVLGLAEGIMVMSSTDAECLRQSLPIYDALYARLQVQIALDQLTHSQPVSILARAVEISNLTRELRRLGRGCSTETLLTVLQTTSLERVQT
jgi:hypothetical protein